MINLAGYHLKLSRQQAWIECDGQDGRDDEWPDHGAGADDDDLINFIFLPWLIYDWRYTRLAILNDGFIPSLLYNCDINVYDSVYLNVGNNLTPFQQYVACGYRYNQGRQYGTKTQNDIDDDNDDNDTGNIMF